MSTRSFSPTRQGNPCLVCGDIKGNCRQTETLNLCMGTSGALPEFRYLGQTKDGLWAKYVIDDGQQQTPAERSQLWQEQQQLRASRAAAEAQARADALPALERDRHYRQLLSQLPLHPEDRADLIRRGLTDEQIEAWGVRSVEQWQKLEQELPHMLTGVALDGRSLNTSKAGYLCPIRDVDGLIVGFQIRARATDGGRYYWLTGKTKKRQNGPTPHLPNGELPLSVFSPIAPQTRFIALAEGVGVKPLIVSQKFSAFTIAAAGANWAGSPQTFKQSIERIHQEWLLNNSSTAQTAQTAHLSDSMTSNHSPKDLPQTEPSIPTSFDDIPVKSSTNGGNTQTQDTTKLPSLSNHDYSKTSALLLPNSPNIPIPKAITSQAEQSLDIATSNSPVFILFPDAGAVRNKNVLRQYRATWKLLKTWGYTVQIAWWGQEDKRVHPDIDELEDLSQIQFISVAEFEAFALPEPKLEQPKPIELSDRQYLDWLEHQFKNDDAQAEAQADKTFLSKIFRYFGGGKPKRKTRQRITIERTAVEQDLGEYRPGAVPEHRKTDTTYKIQYQPGQEAALYREAIALGYHILDISPTGSGKTQRSGNLENRDFTFDIVGVSRSSRDVSILQNPLQ